MTLPARTLDRYGAASRCLLRLREDQGYPALTDSAYLRRYAARFPHWEAHPGELDADSLGIVAQELGVAADMTATRNYAQVLLAHRFGHAVIIATDRAPLQQEQDGASRPHRMLLEQMDEDGFTAWCPFESGASDTLPHAERLWWDRWHAIAYIFRAALPAVA